MCEKHKQDILALKNRIWFSKEKLSDLEKECNQLNEDLILMNEVWSSEEIEKMVEQELNKHIAISMLLWTLEEQNPYFLSQEEMKAL